MQGTIASVLPGPSKCSCLHEDTSKNPLLDGGKSQNSIVLAYFLGIWFLMVSLELKLTTRNERVINNSLKVPQLRKCVAHLYSADAVAAEPVCSHRSVCSVDFQFAA